MVQLASTSGENQTEERRNVVILGGGVLGTELAYSLNRRYVRGRTNPQVKIVQLCHEAGG